MLMTEEEASTKWCPMARVAIQHVASDMAVLTGSSPIHPVGNRATLIAGRERLCDTATGSRCIASECMAWRWSGISADPTEIRQTSEETDDSALRNAFESLQRSGCWGEDERRHFRAAVDNELAAIEARLSVWQPKPPAGDGWTLVNKAVRHDDEETGGADLFARWERPRQNRRGFCGAFGEPEA
ncbi:hypothetical protein GAY28_08160 [Azospirillum brasilense]|nr:hypothetical protein [Azospirillum brasilense]